MQRQRDEQKRCDEKQCAPKEASGTVGRDAADGDLLRGEDEDGRQQPGEVARALNTRAGTSERSR
jgi:hypothetical protein